MFLAIVRRLIDEEILGSTAHPRFDARLLPQGAGFAYGRLEAVERTINVIAVIDNMPLHDWKILW